MEFASCEFIEYGLVFTQDTVKFCTLPAADTTRICDYSGGPLPIDDILAERDRLRRLNNLDPTSSPCSGCQMLRAAEWKKLAGGALFDQLGMANFSGCNARCNYCYLIVHADWDLPMNPYPILPVLRELVETGYLEDGGAVHWGGGELTTLREGPALIQYLAERPYYQDIKSNGIRYSPEVAEGLSKGRLSVIISVDAGTRET